MNAHCECGKTVSWERSESDWAFGKPYRMTWFFKCECGKKFTVVEDK